MQTHPFSYPIAMMGTFLLNCTALTGMICGVSPGPSISASSSSSLCYFSKIRGISILGRTVDSARSQSSAFPALLPHNNTVDLKGHHSAVYTCSSEGDLSDTSGLELSSCQMRVVRSAEQERK